MHAAEAAAKERQVTIISMNEWGRRTKSLADSKGFRDGLTDEKGIEAIGIYVANFHGECSELWEAARKGQLHAPCDKADKMRASGLEPLTCIEEELADMLIRTFDIAAVFGVDIDRAVAIKHAFNETRPHRHGGKLA